MYIQGILKYDNVEVTVTHVNLDLMFCWSCGVYIVRIFPQDVGVDTSTMCTICKENKDYAEAK